VLLNGHTGRVKYGVVDAGVPPEGIGVVPRAMSEDLARRRGRHLQAETRREKGRLTAKMIAITGCHRTAHPRVSDC
jgi:hypothetical protein